MFDYRTAGCRRNYYRLRYPLIHRPQAEISGCHRSYEVTELSERGFRLRCTSEIDDLQPGQGLTSTIFFPTEALEVSGVVARRHRDEVVIVEVEGVSFGLIMDEQRRLAALFLSAVDNAQSPPPRTLVNE